MKTLLLAVISFLALGAQAGDWGKVPILDKTPIEECVDLGGSISASWHSDYIYKGFRFGRDSVQTDVSYGIDGLPIPVTVGVKYVNVINGFGGLSGVIDDLSVYAVGDLGTHAGFDIQLSYTQRFYPELNGIAGGTILSGNGEIGLHVQRDMGIATLKGDILYNLNAPNAFSIFGNNVDNGAWYYDFGAEKSIDLMGHSLVLAGGVTLADNYWGALPGLQTGGRSSGWNHYYLRASLPLELNCRTTLTPYLGYSGAPDTWLMDGILGGGQSIGEPLQSDILHGGVTLSVQF